MKKICLFLFCLALPLACSSQDTGSIPGSTPGQVHDYNSCVAAGNPILKMFPPKCVDRKTGKGYVGPGQKDLHPQATGQAGEGICTNTCGNGTCEQMVCQGQGCPCAETPANCPDDCALQF